MQERREVVGFFNPEISIHSKHNVGSPSRKMVLKKTHDIKGSSRSIRTFLQPDLKPKNLMTLNS